MITLVSLALSLNLSDVDDATISVITQREVTINHMFSAFGLLYKVTSSATGELYTCRNFRPTFYEALMERVNEEMNTMSGEAFHVVPLEQAISLVDKDKAFSLLLTQPVKSQDKDKVLDALTLTWREAFDGEVCFLKHI